MSRWQIPLDQFFDDVERSIVDDFRSMGFELLGDLQFNTPVDTGRLRSAWFVTVNTPDFSDNPADTGEASLVDLSLSSTIILQNNVEYGPYVNDGTQRQAGQFFVEAAVAGFTA